MKKYGFLTICAMLALGHISAQELTFDIVNVTGVDLYGIYVSPAEEDSWGNDILPYELFANETMVTVTVPDTYGETCIFDLLVTVDELQEDALIFTGADLCRIISITIYEDGSYEVVWQE